jgi:hypothetical protein
MAERPLEGNVLERVFRAVGAHLEWDTDVDVLIVGGAALALTCGLPPGRTTLDCDVMDYEPEAAEKAVERAAEAAAKQFDLPDNWLNSHVQWHRESLPEGWRERRRLVSAYGRLRVFAAGRRDLIVMKLISGRAQDLQDVGALMRVEDVAFVRDSLTELGSKSSLSEQVAEAFERLDALELNR